MVDEEEEIAIAMQSSIAMQQMYSWAKTNVSFHWTRRMIRRRRGGEGEGEGGGGERGGGEGRGGYHNYHAVFHSNAAQLYSCQRQFFFLSNEPGYQNWNAVSIAIAELFLWAKAIQEVRSDMQSFTAMQLSCTRGTRLSCPVNRLEEEEEEIEEDLAVVCFSPASGPQSKQFHLTPAGYLLYTHRLGPIARSYDDTEKEMESEVKVVTSLVP